jgi:hypothetical protein
MDSSNKRATKKKFLGMPYDFRRPTVARTKSRYWNPDDKRFFTPKVYGAGWTFNFYWFCHPLKFTGRRNTNR